MEIKTSFYSEAELKAIGFKGFGRNVLISRKASFYNPEEMFFGNNVRIDDFCILSGKISVGSYVHIAAYCGLFGRYGITFKDFSGLSSRISIYTYSDDYLGRCLTNPMVPEEFRTKPNIGPVALEKHALIGCGSVILPNSLIEEGASVGALSLVKGTLKAWGIYTGVPAQYRTKRKSDKMLEMEKDLIEKYGI